MKNQSPLTACLQKGRIEAGCDEAGRGCLAGPVFAAAVILPHDFECPELCDSKKLNHVQRQSLRTIIEKEAVAYAVEMCTPEEIDSINILWASVMAMHRSLDLLPVRPEHVLVDGNRFRQYDNIPHTCVVKGDNTYLSIAAASVLAKTYRDDYMRNLHDQFPAYNWAQNKGYPTKQHYKAINEHGITPFHRLSFHLFDSQLELEFKEQP